jgi:hypothetical protein
MTRPPDPPTCPAVHEDSGDLCSLPVMHRKNSVSTPHWCEASGRRWRGPLKRPTLDDEHGRIKFWTESLDKHGGDRQGVIRSAAGALALRDVEIARLRRDVEEMTRKLNPRKSRTG